MSAMRTKRTCSLNGECPLLMWFSDDARDNQP
jgi:hypothetical protein